MHRIALTPHKQVAGIRTWPVEAADLYEILPLHEALETHFTTDAHFCCYTVRDADGVLYSTLSLEDVPQWPRINKVALPALKKADVEVLSTLLVYDYDLPDHAAWTTDFYRTFVEDTLPALRESLGDLFATYIYLTNHGARFIHTLAKPIPSPEAEGYWAALFEKYSEAGVEVDPACKDWTRLFRLPKVMRDGKSTWTGLAEQFGVLYSPDNYIVPEADLTPQSWKKSRDYSTYLEVRQETMDTPMPPADVALKLLFVDKKQTHAFREARTCLQGRNCYPVLFEDQPLGSPGERDHRLTSLVGEACRLLTAYNERTGGETFKPEHVYALFLPAIDDLEPDPGTPSWEESAWNKILRFWSTSDAQVRAERKESEERKRDEAETRLDGLRSWTDCPDVHNANDDYAKEFMAQNLILLTPGGQVVCLDRNGYYTRPVSKMNAYAVLANLGLTGDLVQDARITRDGGSGGLIALPELLKYYGCGTTITEVAASVANDHPIIDGFGTQHARLVYPIAKLNGRIESCFMEEVEQWLRYMVGNENLARLKKWIAYALDFRAGPISALALVGPPSIGKKLLVQGFAECFADHTVVPGAAIIEGFQREMTRSIVINADEGLPKDGPGARMAFKDRIRSLTAGDPVVCNIKYQDSVVVRAPFRIFLTANNDSIVDGLVGLQLEHHDPEAIGMRVLRFEGKREAADYLERVETRKRRWITGDGGAPSNYVIARHFLWLHEHREDFGSTEGRFLVQGNAHEGIRARITQSSPAQVILNALVRTVLEVPKMLKQADAENVSRPMKKTLESILAGTAFKDGHVWMTLQAIKDFCDYKSIETPRLDRHSTLALRSMAPQGYASNGSMRARILALHGEYRNVHWWAVDGRWIMDYAFESGIAEPLEVHKIMNKRRSHAE